MNLQGNWMYYRPSADCPIPQEAVINRIAIGSGLLSWMNVVRGRNYVVDDTQISTLETLGVLKFDQGKWKFYSLTEIGFSKSHVHNMTCDSEGKVWFDVTQGGLCRFDGRTAELFNESNSDLPKSSHVYALAVGGDEKVWAAMGVDGIFCFSGSVWKKLFLEDHEIARELDDKKDLSRVMQSGPFNILSVTQIAVDHVGNVWFVAEVESQTRVIFLKYDGKQIEEVSNLTYRGTVTAMTIDKQNALWVSWLPWDNDVENSLWSLGFGETEWARYTSENSALSGLLVESLCVDKVGRVWAGTVDGFTIFQGMESVNWEVMRPGVSHRPLTRDDLTRDDMYSVNEARVNGEESPFVWINRYGSIDEQGQVWAQAGHNGVAMFLED